MKKSVVAKSHSRLQEQSISDVLAGDKFCYVNYHVPQLREAFFDNHKLWSVDKMYPHAQGGMLLIDEPKTPEDIDLCEIKKTILHRAGFRYGYISSDMSLADAIVALGSIKE